MTCLPLPFPSLAPSMIPGKSRSYRNTDTKQMWVLVIKRTYKWCERKYVGVDCVKIYTGWPRKNGTVDTVDFSELCSDQQLLFFTLLDRASFPHYNNTKIIKFGRELFILWAISYGLSFSGFARFPEFRGTINDILMANPENDSP